MILKKIFLKLGPKFTSRAIALTLAFLLCFGIYQAFMKPPKVSHTDTQSPSADSPHITDTEKTDTENAVNPQGNGTTTYTIDGSKEITTPLSSTAALLCNNAQNTVNLRKNAEKAVTSAPILALSVALTVLDAIEKGEASPSDRAVCPATAVRLPCYSASSYIISVGQSLTVAELVKTMLCTQPELFAYTLAIHIYGSESEFLTHMNTLLKSVGTTNTVFRSLTDSEKQTTTVLDAAIIFRAATENTLLRSLLASREAFTVSASGSAWNTVTLCGRFYSECCTEGQAKADGIICGYYGEYGGKQYVYMLFEQLGTTYLTVAIGGSTAYADSLILLSNAGK